MKKCESTLVMGVEVSYNQIAKELCEEAKTSNEQYLAFVNDYCKRRGIDIDSVPSVLYLMHKLGYDKTIKENLRKT